MTEQLRVFLGQKLVGWLSQKLLFEYAPSWLEDQESFAISASLPLSSEPSNGAFFANLLPEGSVREAVARRVGVSASNDFALLAAIGGECAGALMILPESAAFDSDPGYEPLRPETIADMARRFSVLPEVSGDPRLRLSLAGAQDKLPVRRDDDGSFWLPVGGAASTHILKVPSRDFKHLPANEVLVTRLARRLGLATVDAELVDVDGVPIAVVRRYDRISRGGVISRLHQEDLCQAMGLLPSTKYEIEGGPSFAAAMTLVRGQSIRPLVDAGQLLRWLLFLLLGGNADGHGKNISLVHDAPGRPRLAPFYDLVCTRAYPGIDRSLAMAIGGERDPGQIGRSQLQKLARETGIGPRLVLGEVERLAAKMPAAFEEVAGEHTAAHGESPAVGLIREVIRRQCRRTLALLRRSG
jgi:serine/threonine-protein kinase HipA